MLDAEIDAKYERMGTDWRCLDCTFASRNRHHVIEHIEAKAGVLLLKCSLIYKKN